MDNRPVVGPHHWYPQRWRFWICRECYAPQRLHPRTEWVRPRRPGDHTYYGPDAPHFREGW